MGGAEEDGVVREDAYAALNLLLLEGGLLQRLGGLALLGRSGGGGDAVGEAGVERCVVGY